MKELARRYFSDLGRFMAEIEVTEESGAKFDLAEGIEAAALLCRETGTRGGKLMFIGNGASAAISSHMSADFWKNGGIRAVAFNDSSGLTCVGNDFGYVHVFEKPVEMFEDKGDVLVAISSSGASENILRAAEMAKAKGCGIMTLSGFKPDNPLRGLGRLNFYVPARDYGPVEVLHHGLCHCILDVILRGPGRP